MDTFSIILIDLLITIVVFLAFPTIHTIMKGKIPMQKAKKYALWNSIICLILFFIVVSLITDGATASVNLAPGVLYYYIAKSIMGDKKTEETKNNNNINEDNFEKDLDKEDEYNNDIDEDDECNDDIDEDDVADDLYAENETHYTNYKEENHETNESTIRKSKKYKLKRYK